MLTGGTIWVLTHGHVQPGHEHRPVLLVDPNVSALNDPGRMSQTDASRKAAETWPSKHHSSFQIAGHLENMRYCFCFLGTCVASLGTHIPWLGVSIPIARSYIYIYIYIYIHIHIRVSVQGLEEV